MKTTIQISNSTRRMLNTVRREENKSYDEVLREILSKLLNSSESLEGKYPEIKWSKKNKLKFKHE